MLMYLLLYRSHSFNIFKGVYMFILFCVSSSKTWYHCKWKIVNASQENSHRQLDFFWYFSGVLTLRWLKPFFIAKVFVVFFLFSLNELETHLSKMIIRSRFFCSSGDCYGQFCHLVLMLFNNKLQNSTSHLPLSILINSYPQLLSICATVDIVR